MRSLDDHRREAELAEQDDRDLDSRSDRKRARVAAEDALKDLGRRLIALTPKQLSALELPEAVQAAVLDAQRIKSAIAAQRQLRRVRAELRAVDAEQIRGRLASRNAPEEDTALRWCQRLLREGDGGLGQFVERYPGANRQELRQLLRACQRARPLKGSSSPPAPAAARAQGKLLEVLRSILSGAA